jgi:uncharacterized membrane protein YeiB
MQEAGSGFTPVTQNQRIHMMDVLRGFALLGIFLMNVEGFTRPWGDVFANRLPTGMSVVDWLASAFSWVFVVGKFWTLFALLFGMGFAVMLERATQSNRDFIAPYLRRTFALLLFGVLHYIFAFQGDILRAYALGALILLLVLFARWYWLLLLYAASMVLGQGFGLYYVPPITLFLAFITVLYLRSDANVPLFGVRWHVSALCLWAYGLAWLGVALFGGKTSNVLFSFLAVTAGWFAQRFYQPPGLRALRAGAGWYVAWVSLGLLWVAWMWLHPEPQTAEAVAKQVSDQAALLSKESLLISGGSWWALVQSRLTADGLHINVDLAVPTFLMGFWFIRSGVMRNVQEHLPMFRKLTYLALPASVLLSAADLLISPNTMIGKNEVQHWAAMQLHYLAGLLGALGYLGLVTVLMQGAAAKWLSWLAPAGRMALTNYLMQSVLMGLFFYGYGLGHYGMGRAGQFAFVLVVYVAQVVFSQLWLRHFRYGPFEWLWRSITYWRWQPMREISAA